MKKWELTLRCQAERAYRNKSPFKTNEKTAYFILTTFLTALNLKTSEKNRLRKDQGRNGVYVVYWLGQLEKINNNLLKPQCIDPNFADWAATSEEEQFLPPNLLWDIFFLPTWEFWETKAIVVSYRQKVIWSEHLNTGSDVDGRNPAITKQAACMRGCCKRRNNKRLVLQGLV